MKKYRLTRAIDIPHGTLKVGTPFIEKDGLFWFPFDNKEMQISFPVYYLESSYYEEIKTTRGVRVKIQKSSDAPKAYHPTFAYLIAATHEIPASKFIGIEQAIEKKLNGEESDEFGYFKMQQRWVDEFMIGLWEQGIRLRNQSTNLQVLLPNILQVIKSLTEEWNEKKKEDRTLKPLKDWYDGKKYTEKDMEDCFNSARVYDEIMFRQKNFKDYLKSLNK